MKALLFLPSSVARIMMVLIIMFHDVCWASLLLEGGSIERQLPPSAQFHMPASTGPKIDADAKICQLELFRPEAQASRLISGGIASRDAK